MTDTGRANPVVRFVKIGFLSGVVIFLLAQLIRPDITNPPIDEARTFEATLKVTPEVKALVSRSCIDCHTYRTRWPWYTHVTPVSFLIAHDVAEGRKHVDLSDWARYDSKAQQQRLAAMCNEVLNEEMPLPKYLKLHPEARVSEAEAKAFCAWTDVEIARLRAEAEAKTAPAEPAPDSAPEAPSEAPKTTG